MQRASSAVFVQLTVVAWLSVLCRLLTSRTISYHKRVATKVGHEYDILSSPHDQDEAFLVVQMRRTLVGSCVCSAVVQIAVHDGPPNAGYVNELFWGVGEECAASHLTPHQMVLIWGMGFANGCLVERRYVWWWWW